MIKKNSKSQTKKIVEKTVERSRLTNPLLGLHEKEKAPAHQGLIIR